VREETKRTSSNKYLKQEALTHQGFFLFRCAAAVFDLQNGSEMNAV
jgi:hypothetical protein